MTRDQTTLTELAKLGFADLGTAKASIAAQGVASFLPTFATAANPDQALEYLARLRERAPAELSKIEANPEAVTRLVRVLGASTGLGDFLTRWPTELAALSDDPVPLNQDQYRADLLSVVQTDTVDAAIVALRVRYRRHLLQLTAWDLGHPDPIAAVSTVSIALADLAGAALDASLDVARRSTRFAAAEVDATRLAIIGMGKAGARELNYVSDVDVIFVAETSGELPGDRAVAISTQLAMQTMRGIHDPALEPELWEVDANLRPEGKDGALVRTLESHVAYYERWASSWVSATSMRLRHLCGRVLRARALWSPCSGCASESQRTFPTMRSTFNSNWALADSAMLSSPSNCCSSFTDTPMMRYVRAVRCSRWSR
jgi:[glutamine synthetase] adenylyltransferase / [glutamine synthetase]-adenylyl-L-tyrosine phosphorylase